MTFFLKYKGLSYYLYSLSPARLLKTWYLGHRNASVDVLGHPFIKNLFIYLPVLGLSYVMWDRQSSLRHAGSLVVACGI